MYRRDVGVPNGVGTFVQDQRGLDPWVGAILSGPKSGDPVGSATLGRDAFAPRGGKRTSPSSANVALAVEVADVGARVGDKPSGGP
jgi:hypothetical protein